MGFFANIREAVTDRIYGASLREAEFMLESADNQLSFMREALEDAQMQLDTIGWIEMGGGTPDDLGHDRLVKAATTAKSSYLLNPMIHQGVGVVARYVWALGFTVEHEDKTIEARIKAMISDPKNFSCVFSTEAGIELEREMMQSGNVFFVVQVKKEIPDVRWFCLEEIKEIIADPDDVRCPMLYKRCYSKQVFDQGSGRSTSTAYEEYYWDANYNGSYRGLTSINDRPISTTHEIIHSYGDRLGRMLYGFPEIFSALGWATAYKSFLEDWIKILRAHASIIWKATIKGGPKAIKAAKAKLDTTITTGDTRERNPPKTVGAGVMGPPGSSLEVMKTSNAAENPESARRVHLMTVAGIGIPETFFGDVQVGSEATATQLDRPTELMVITRQQRWRNIFKMLFSVGLGLTSEQREGIKLEMPEVVNVPVRDLVSALVDGATMKGLPSAGVADIKTISKKILSALRIPNASDVVDAMYPDAEFNPKDWAVANPEEQRQQMSLQQNPGSATDPNAQDPPSSKTQLRPGRSPGRTRPNDGGPR